MPVSVLHACRIVLGLYESIAGALSTFDGKLGSTISSSSLCPARYYHKKVANGRRTTKHACGMVRASSSLSSLAVQLTTWTLGRLILCSACSSTCHSRDLVLFAGCSCSCGNRRELTVMINNNSGIDAKVIQLTKEMDSFLVAKGTELGCELALEVKKVRG